MYTASTFYFKYGFKVAALLMLTDKSIVMISKALSIIEIFVEGY